MKNKKTNVVVRERRNWHFLSRSLKSKRALMAPYCHAFVGTKKNKHGQQENHALVATGERMKKWLKPTPSKGCSMYFSGFFHHIPTLVPSPPRESHESPLSNSSSSHAAQEWNTYWFKIQSQFHTITRTAVGLPWRTRAITGLPWLSWIRHLSCVLCLLFHPNGFHSCSYALDCRKLRHTYIAISDKWFAESLLHQDSQINGL